MTEADIMVESAALPALAERRLEVCEHKGVGHPDTLTDGACEAAAVALAGAYRRAFGRAMHFNVDKGLLVGGRSAPRFAGGVVLEPAKLVLCGRASDAGGRFDVADVALRAARGHLERALRRGAAHIEVRAEIRRGSASLESIYGGEQRAANDTSLGAGYWPYSPLEARVLRAAALLRSSELRERFPAAGDDFKVMGLRRDASVSLTVALAMVDSAVRSAAEYFEAKRSLEAHLAARLDGASVAINMLDDAQTTDERGLYLTVTGTSAEMGDDGQVGRGNRVNGLITPGRAMSLEAAAGKNPAAHVGKIYNVLATEIARSLCEELPELREASVQLVSQIGRPVAEPWAAAVEVRAARALDEVLRAQVRRVLARHLAGLDERTRRLEAYGLPDIAPG
ncbi:MAG TPA: methionine adenosyltransferase [Burkholderiales bacterium]|nr:methionine adenosyltransferase [Burkholderiales bacterium]